MSLSMTLSCECVLQCRGFRILLFRLFAMSWFDNTLVQIVCSVVV